MPSLEVKPGVAHEIASDMKKALTSSEEVLEKWNSLTPLARNEWICWVEAVKKAETRKEHIERLQEDLLKGKRRPCCWIGCVHRKDKPMSASQKYILGKGAKNKKNNKKI